MADVNNYVIQLARFRTRRNESVYLYPLLSSLPQHLDAFKTYKSMLSLGPGPGQYDIELMERSLPSLEHYTGVECDDYCCNELDKHLKARMGDKLKWKICKEDMLTWKNESRFDIVMMSHCLYNTTRQDRKDLLKRCLDDWLTPNGVLLLLELVNENDSEGNTKLIWLKFKAVLGEDMKEPLVIKEVLEDLVELGGEVLFEQSYDSDIDLREFGEDIVFGVNLYTTEHLGAERVKDMLPKLKLPGGIGKYCAKLALIRKK